MRLLLREPVENFENFSGKVLDGLLRTIPSEDRIDLNSLRIVMPKKVRDDFSVFKAKLQGYPIELADLVFDPLTCLGVPVLEGPPDLIHVELYTTRYET